MFDTTDFLLYIYTKFLVIHASFIALDGVREKLTQT